MAKIVTFKILTAGDGGVGKTTLIHRYLKGEFLKDTQMTIGVDFMITTVQLGDIEIRLQIWDFGGQDRFKKMLKGYVSGAQGAILMFDLTRPRSFYNIDDWLDILYSKNKLPILLIGTKNDLDEYINVADEEVIALKQKYGFIDYLKTSALTGENVQLAFETLARLIYEKRRHY